MTQQTTRQRPLPTSPYLGASSTYREASSRRPDAVSSLAEDGSLVGLSGADELVDVLLPRHVDVCECV